MNSCLAARTIHIPELYSVNPAGISAYALPEEAWLAALPNGSKFIGQGHFVHSVSRSA